MRFKPGTSVIWSDSQWWVIDGGVDSFENEFYRLRSPASGQVVVGVPGHEIEVPAPAEVETLVAA